MTDQLMFQAWTHLLRPLFPPHAEFSFKPRRRSLSVSWSPDETRQVRRSVTITFTNLAWKGYRGARSARRSRADQRLEALVRSHLGQGQEPDELRSPECEISVASVDLFPPMAGMGSSAEDRATPA